MGDLEDSGHRRRWRGLTLLGVGQVFDDQIEQVVPGLGVPIQEGVDFDSGFPAFPGCDQEVENRPIRSEHVLGVQRVAAHQFGRPARDKPPLHPLGVPSVVLRLQRKPHDAVAVVR